MVIDELVEQIRERFQKGQHRHEIKEDLMVEGYDEEDIDDTIEKLQHDVFKQLPGISWIYQHIEHFESRLNSASTRTTVFLMVACIIFLVVLAGALYFFLDPLGSRVGGR